MVDNKLGHWHQQVGIKGTMPLPSVRQEFGSGSRKDKTTERFSPVGASAMSFLGALMLLVR